MKRLLCVTLCVTWLSGSLILAQDGDRAPVPLTDPSRPARVNVDLMNGDVTVRGYAGKEVIVEMKGSGRASRASRRRSQAEMEGLKRIDLDGTGAFDIEERDNVVTIKSRSGDGGGAVIQVPEQSTVKVKTMGGTVAVESVRGEVEATSLNGNVRVMEAQGSVIAHSLNGNVVVTLNRVEEKPMSFSTMNGDIDVTMPASTKAMLKLKNDHGEVYSDFEMKLQSTPKMESGRQSDGKYKVKFDRTMHGSINGGGPEISFTTLNGQIRIRQKK